MLRSLFQNLAVILFFGLTLSAENGWASATICVTDAGTPAAFTVARSEIAPIDLDTQLAAGLQCKTLSHVNTGLQVVSFGLQAGAFVSACTGVGAPLTVGLEGGALGFQALSLLVSNLPCENGDSEAQIEKAVHAAVCAELEKNGIKCDR